MHALRQGQRRAARHPARLTAARGVASALLAALLPACSSGPSSHGGSTAAWGFVTLALVLVAVAAYAAGSARSRLAHQQALREARRGFQQLDRLQDGWLWETDASHRLLSWRAAGQAALQTCTLFDAGDGPLPRQLRAEQAFDGLRLRSERPQNGHFGWQLRGLPSHDDLGRFNGFTGTAQATDDADAVAAAAAALPPLLAAWPAPVLVALDQGRGLHIHQFNAAALALWPGLAAGDALQDRLSTLPAAVQAALQPASHDGNVAATDPADGWQALPFNAAAAGRGLVLARQPVAQPAAGDASAQTGEGDNFSFTVSHDLRAPIRVVEGFTRIVKEDYGRLLDRVGNDHLDRVLGAAARMNLMIDALLTLARLSAQPLARQPVNLSQLAAYVVDDLRRSAPEREADIDIQPALSAQGDPTLLRLVLENLLGNAWKYSGRNPRAQISLRAEAHGPRTAFVVRDNGAGFDMRSADRLFGLFQRLHSASEFAGHGVGLASVRRIVRRHGGDIWAEAEPGRGAAFFFTLG